MKKYLSNGFTLIGFVFLILFIFDFIGVYQQYHYINQIDSFFIEYLRGDKTNPNHLIIFLTNIGSAETLGIITLVITGILFWKKKIMLGVWFISTYVISVGFLTYILKHLIKRARPEEMYWLIQEHGFSFPSGHSMASSVFFGLIGLFIFLKFSNKIAKIIGVLIALLAIVFILYSRIYLGVHYPSDVLGGFLLGICCAFISVGIYESKFYL